MGTDLKIGLRYCGGCNPRYDRVKVVEKLKKLLPDVEFFNAEEGGDYSAVLIVSGCPTQCTKIDDLDVPAGRMIRLNGFEDLLPVRDNIKELGQERESFSLTKDEVLKILPHKEPMLFIDDVPHLIPGEEIVARYKPAKDLDIFSGHFPGEPVFPGVLTVEAMAQAADLMLLTLPGYQGRTPYFAGIESAGFRRRIMPEDEMYIYVSLKDERKDTDICVCRCRVKVNEKTVSEAEIVLALR